MRRRRALRRVRPCAQGRPPAAVRRLRPRHAFATRPQAHDFQRCAMPCGPTPRRHSQSSSPTMLTCLDAPRGRAPGAVVASERWGRWRGGRLGATYGRRGVGAPLREERKSERASSGRTAADTRRRAGAAEATRRVEQGGIGLSPATGRNTAETRQKHGRIAAEIDDVSARAKCMVGGARRGLLSSAPTTNRTLKPPRKPAHTPGGWHGIRQFPLR